MAPFTPWKRLTRPRFLFVYPLMLGLFLFSHVTERSLRVGVVFVLLGETLRFLANGYVGHHKVNWTQKWRGDAKVGQLITAGPYAFVQHPLYLGTLLIGTGFCLMGGNLWVALLALVGFLGLYRRKMAQEEAVILDERPEEYAAYHAAVPQLVPKWYRYPHRHGQWGWQGIAASKEWKTALWILVVIILVYLWEEWVQEREPFFNERAGYRVFLIGLVLALMVTDGVIEVIRRRRKAARAAADDHANVGMSKA